MAMQIESSDDDVMSEINMTPFVDVMLVLLIIFLVTLPLVHHSVNIQLPKVTSQKLIELPDPIKISVDVMGDYRLNNEPITLDILRATLHEGKQREPQPIVHLYADQDVRYELVAKLLAEVHQSGLSKIGFVTQEQTPQSPASLSSALKN